MEHQRVEIARTKTRRKLGTGKNSNNLSFIGIRQRRKTFWEGLQTSSFPADVSLMPFPQSSPGLILFGKRQL